ncbi:histone deacetylase complex subunit SAP18 [Tribolium castaneum]|uniref:18 kDa Sin3-associated polypeptide n=1 Tax=Tribolium castaneum TaxID=7070 RepID=D6WCC4_TRICA|nr:PREDICTED: histone deacetylase complex subunit SAP18 [Tribolium castaneum]EEZ97816.1 Histone deacetylase complex subunit SAP18-like Protein [Tribolium castaneum]|eukprot:XP_973842.1 PREDICTED: histone deacetylase complex subunit SAP18 [Tribolium castaneum]
MASVDVVIEEKKDDAVDRQKVCPFLLRVFVSSNGYHHKPTDYNKGNTPQNELQIYTWKDATLHELTQLVKEVNPEARRKGTKFSFSLVFPDMRVPIYRMREIGSTTTGIKGPDDLKTLSQARFAIGDFMDIAITPADSWNTGGRKGYAQNYNNHRQRPY